MTDRYRPEQIGSILFGFYPEGGALTVEMWRRSRRCRISVLSGGVLQTSETVLDDRAWYRVMNSLSVSGFWNWNRRYSAYPDSLSLPSWKVDLMTDSGWYCSSGSGVCPEGFGGVLRGMTELADGIRGTPSLPPGSAETVTRMTEAPAV